MSKEEMIAEALKLDAEYQDELKKNGGFDGTTAAFGALMQLLLVQRFLKEYFDYEFSFNRPSLFDSKKEWKNV